MITRQEFVEKYNAYEKQANKHSVRFFAMFAVVLVLTFIPMFFLMNQVPPDSLWYLILLCFFFGSLGIMVYFNIKLDNEKFKELGLFCSHCSKRLRRDITVTTGRCGSCGEKIFEMDN